jgi:hypothetical protein
MDEFQAATERAEKRWREEPHILKAKYEAGPRDP